MPFSLPAEYGRGVGGFKPLTTTPITINLKESGVDLSAAASQLEEGRASNAKDVRFTGGGVSTDYDVSAFGTPYAGAGSKKILHINNYDKKDTTRFLMRLRSAAWDRWNGVNWLTLPGALTGTPFDPLTSLTAQDLFVAANAIDRLKSWDGVDANAVQDLSADAPIARYITKIGTRIMAASIKVGGVENPFLVAWCTDGNILDWTTALSGAGSVEPPVEGIDRLPGFIRGLSTLQRGAVIYRQNTIQIATLTGIGAAPFKFSTLDFNHGTESPYSIKSGGMKTGDFFLGSDYMVYNYDGTEFLPIGLPIYERLRDSISDRSLVTGAVDFNEQEYHLSYPSASDEFLVETWAFNIKEFVRGGKLVWRRRSLPNHTTAFGYGFLGVVNDPIVDTITDIVDTISIRVDDWNNSFGPERILFGDDAGQVWQIDKATPITTGIWESKEFLYENNEVNVDRVRLKYIAKELSTVAVAVSTDGGLNYQNEKIYTLNITGTGDGEVTDTLNVTGRSVMFRLRPLTGFCIVNQLVASLQNRGQTNG